MREKRQGRRWSVEFRRREMIKRVSRGGDKFSSQCIDETRIDLFRNEKSLKIEKKKSRNTRSKK